MYVHVLGRCVVVLLVCLAGACRVPGSGSPWDPASGAPPPHAVRWGVGGTPQRHSLSCESRSACDLLRWHGHALEEDAFLARLPRSDNPEWGFVGDVDDPGGGLPPAGYGVYEGPVAACLRAGGLDAVAVRDRDLAWLRREIARGCCVIVWATAALDAPPPQRFLDGSGRAYLAVRGEHTFLAVGYEPGTVLLLDPATGAVKEVEAGRFRRSWENLGGRAVTTGAPRACVSGGR